MRTTIKWWKTTHNACLCVENQLLSSSGKVVSSAPFLTLDTVGDPGWTQRRPVGSVKQGSAFRHLLSTALRLVVDWLNQCSLCNNATMQKITRTESSWFFRKKLYISEHLSKEKLMKNLMREQFPRREIFI